MDVAEERTSEGWARDLTTLGPVFDGSATNWSVHTTAAGAVPWYRQVKRRRVCASAEWDGVLPARLTADPANAEARKAWPLSDHSDQLLFPPSAADGGASLSNRSRLLSSAASSQQAAVVDLYDTSDSEDDRTHPVTKAPASNRGSNDPGSVRQTTHSLDRTRLVPDQQTIGSTQPIMKAAGNTLRWKARFRTGLDLINASSHDID
jgi:hypothetical protein